MDLKQRIDSLNIIGNEIKENLGYGVSYVVIRAHITNQEEIIKELTERETKLVQSLQIALDIAEQSEEDPDTVLIEHIKQTLTNLGIN